MTGLPPQPANLGEVEGLITREGPGVEIVNCVIIFPCVLVWFINYYYMPHCIECNPETAWFVWTTKAGRQTNIERSQQDPVICSDMLCQF